jgi:hypothetical protein
MLDIQLLISAVYGLAIGGSEGAEFILRCLLAEADLTMGVDTKQALLNNASMA